ncbi:MAG TPA: DEAD/DEAH box helicase [archaeon]|nr:DEAD/DEAH box helicase [archaeon]
MEKETVQRVLSARGYLQLNPVQELAVKSGLLSGRNMVVCAPTASGKTLIGELAALHTLSRKKGKVVYVGPLRALAWEHYNTFKNHYEKLGVRVSLTTGDSDSSDPWLKDADWIVSTYEKLSSLLVHKAQWLKDVRLLIVDEVHLVDSDRGPGLEVMVTKLKKTTPNLQIVALSATVPNYLEIAGWLDAEFVYSDWRPVKLSKGVFWENGIKFDNKETHLLASEDDPLEAIIGETLRKEKQALVFRNTRKNAQSTAKKLAQKVKALLREEDKGRLKALSLKALNVLEDPTRQCVELSECIESGTAFHTAGLMARQREIVERGFREGLIKVICATPTLAAGVNLPANRVIIKDLNRYSGNGLTSLPVGEVHQMFGRAGRPGYDSEGEAICIANSREQFELAWEKYVKGNPEPVYSKLGLEPVLRGQVLGCIASGFTLSRNALTQFLSETLYAHQFGNVEALMITVNSIIEGLKHYGFVTETNEKLIPTRLGVRVSELSLDPVSANNLVNNLKKTEKEGFKELGLVYSFAGMNEMAPYLSVPASREIEVWEEAAELAGEFYYDPVTLSFQDMHAMNKFRLSQMVRDWVNEKSEEFVLEKYGVAPGVLHSNLENLDWLTYAGVEISKLLELEKAAQHCARLRRRINYGVKEELLELVAVKNIGRVRARRLWGSGIKNVSGLKNAGQVGVAKVLGEGVAKAVFDKFELKKD